MKLPSPIPDPDARLRGEALDWFIRRSGDEWTARDEAAFAAWLNADSAHRRTFARWEAHWQALDKLPPMAVARLRAAPSESRNAPVDSGGEAPVWGRWPASPALLPPLRRRSLAIGLAALGLVAGAFAYHHQYVDPVFSQVIATPRGGSLSARLPDGTGIEIDTATRLQVTYQRGRRLIALAEGQALFSVQPDSGRPFIVTAGSVRVRVVGTRFSVRHTPEIPGEPGVAVAVDEGRVRVEPERGIAGVWLGALGWRPGGTLLSAGERLVTGADGTPGPVTPLPEAGIASWREDRVSFVDAPSDRPWRSFSATAIPTSASRTRRLPPCASPAPSIPGTAPPSAECCPAPCRSGSRLAAAGPKSCSTTDSRHPPPIPRKTGYRVRASWRVYANGSQPESGEQA